LKKGPAFAKASAGEGKFFMAAQIGQNAILLYGIGRPEKFAQSATHS